MTKRQQARLKRRPFHPTITDVRRWTAVLNCILFGGNLPAYRQITVRRMKAYAQVHCQEGKRTNYCTLEIHNRFPTFGAFFSVLAHELVHVADYMHYGDIDRPDHGRFFFSHRELFRSIGLRLHRGY